MDIDMFFLIITLVLLAWFSLIITGLSIGKIKLIGGSIKHGYDFLTTSWLIIYSVLVLTSFWFMGIIKYIIAVFLFIWIAVQSLNWLRSTPQGIVRYNKIFVNNHHIIPPSDKIIIPDTYHIVLLFLVVLAFITNIVFIIA